MSKLSEYLSLIPKGIPNAKGILNALANNIKMEFGMMPEDKQEEILRRRVICKGCPFMSENAKTSDEFLNLTAEHYKTDRTDEHCSWCGCPTDTRTADLNSNCGIETFNREHPEHAMELKWKKYE